MALGTGLANLYPLTVDVVDTASGNNGTNTGVTFVADGAITVASFNGTSSRFTTPNQVNDPFSVENTTVSLWLKTTGASTSVVIGSSYTSGGVTNPVYALYLYGTGLANALIRSNAGTLVSTIATTAINDGAWHHVCYTRSATQIEIFIDGVSEATGGFVGGGTLNNNNVGGFGCHVSVPISSVSSFYDGLMSDAATWNRVLSGAEITDIYNAGAGGLLSLIGPATLEGQFASVVHTVAASDNNLEGQFASVVHSVAALNNNLEGQWLSVVHTVPSPAAIVPDIVGNPGVVATFDGSASVGVTYYHWSWVTVPGGSAIANAAIPFPDNGAATPLDMTNNEGLWHFEGNANDTSGNVRNGTVTGASLVAGKVGAQAYQFGVADNVNFGAASSFISSNFTISLWIKGDAAWTPATWDSITGASNGFTWSQGFGIFWQNATTIRCFVGAYTGSYADITASSITSWNHVVMTYDGSNITAFWNGAQASQTAHSSALTGLTNDFFVSYLGTHGGGEQSIDEVAIWSRAISASEITDIYAAQSGLVAGVGSSSFAFTPDLVGTYTVKLATSATLDTTADCVVTSPSGGGGDPIQGASLQGGNLQGAHLEGSI